MTSYTDQITEPMDLFFMKLDPPAQPVLIRRLKHKLSAWMTNFWRAGLATFLIASTGCVPFPHTETLTPTIQGNITREKAPVSDIKVSAHSGWTQLSCQGQSISTRSAHDGHFQLSRQSKLRWLYVPLVAPLAVTHWELCMTEDGNTRAVYRSITMQSRNDPLEFQCDLAQGLCTPVLAKIKQ